MRYDFDAVPRRRGTDSVKWGLYPEDVIPLWVADMDFVSAAPILEALRERTDHGVFGYSRPCPELAGCILDRMRRLYGWEIAAPDIVYIPGVVSGLNIAFEAFASPGEGILAQPPVYGHFLRDPVSRGRVLRGAPLVRRGDSYEIDPDLLEHAITADTKLFVLCNPHNPVGRAFTRPELETIADVCLRHGLVICSDEIHCDLVYPPRRHIPIAVLGPEVEACTITLMAPSKTYNIAGLGCAFALIRNPRLRARWDRAASGIVPWVTVMGHVAASAAYRHGQEWLDQVLAYLVRNRDYVHDFVGDALPGVSMCRVEATYLAWLDCSEAGLGRHPFRFFLDRARVALNDGAQFGEGYGQFVRLNFACPRTVLQEALCRMAEALRCI